MRIIYLHQYFNGPSESGSTRSYEFAKRWVKEGHDVQVITTDRAGSNDFRGWRESMLDGIKIHRVSIPYSNALGFIARVRAFIRFAMSAGSRAKEIGGDVVFATSTPLTIAIPGARVSRALRIPMVFEVRDLWPEVPIAMGIIKNPMLKTLARILEKYAYKRASQVIALSPGMRDGVLRAGGRAAEVHVIPNACDVEFFQSGDSSRFFEKHPELVGKKIVVYAGTFGDVNGVDFLVQVAREMDLVRNDIAFVLVGSGKHYNGLVEQAKLLGLFNRNLFVLPPVPKEAMPDLLAASAISTSLVVNNQALWVNSANKFFDAMAAARPIAINHRGWLAELIEQRDLGLVLPAEEPEDAAIEIAALLSDGARLKRMQRNALSIASRHFSRDRLSEKVLDILLKSVDSK